VDTIPANTLASGNAPRGVAHGPAKSEQPHSACAMLNIAPDGIEERFIELSRLPPGPPDLARVAEICGRYGITCV
jgi:hypothetical protein